MRVRQIQLRATQQKYPNPSFPAPQFSVRFGISEAHGQANAIQFNWLLERGVIKHDAGTGRFLVDAEAFPGAISELVGRICILQAEGDYAAAKSMVQQYATMPTVLAEALARLAEIPVDIRPVYPAAEGI